MDLDTKKALITVLVSFSLWAVLVTVMPFFTVWSINTLFGLEIQMSFKVWCSVAWLMMIVRGVKVNIGTKTTDD